MEIPALLPKTVDVRIPQTHEECDTIRKQVKDRFDAWVTKYGPFPDKNPLNIKTQSERKWYWGFRELHLTYECETGDLVSAYLLIPENGNKPFPAVVANHQCAVDCDLGKDAVVGKAVLRSDQAYGFELVRQGFVVLAPDSINCGERNIKQLRPQGTNDKRRCFDAALSHISVKSLYLKHLWDAIRAVDVLESFDFVDSHRIGMIGHSLGAGTTFWAAAFDTRIRASVLSCHFLGGLGVSGWGHFYRQSENGLYYHELLSLIVPRACLATRGRKEIPFTLQGDFVTSEEENSVLEWAFKLGGHWCSLHGVSEERMQVQFFDGGHEFPEEQRNYAYKWLAKHLEG